MNNLVTVWCEWDIGQHRLIFANAQVAEQWLRNNLILQQMAEDEQRPFNEFYECIIDDCLIGIENMELIK